MNTHHHVIEAYKQDCLEQGFEQLTIKHPDDYEGSVVSTLIRKLSERESDWAILYIHGFNDYFFQAEMADWFCGAGFNFYATDLRKYGRSWRKHQKLNNVRNISEYYADIDKALSRIKLEGNNRVVLCGHSTGGLIAALYAHDHPNSELFNALFLNSPFFEFNLPFLTKSLAVPLVSALGQRWPNQAIKGGVSKFYGYSLHHSKKGEWEYNLDWKPHHVPNVNFGFIRAIYSGHKRIRKGLHLTTPTLVMHAMHSFSDRHWSDDFFRADAVLDVKQIRRGAERIDGLVEIHAIQGGMHDLFLSQTLVRHEVYKHLADWVGELAYEWQQENKEVI